MFIDRLSIRNVRSLESLEIELGEGITVLFGPNGVGKTSVIESIFYALTGRSCRTKNIREIIKNGEDNFRVEIEINWDGKIKLVEAALDRAMNKVHLLDGDEIKSFSDGIHLPRVEAFVPDKLEIVKGGPGTRRVHLDSFASVLSKSYADVRSRYVGVLAQRNALISRGVRRDGLGAWNTQLAGTALELTSMRHSAVSTVEKSYKKYAKKLGLTGESDIEYRPSVRCSSQKEYELHYAEKTEQDLERGFTTTGPHRDDIKFIHGGKDVRKYGSQGEQRTTLLALLLAEREVVMDKYENEYVLLLDDVLSELDREKRELLLKELETGGQSVITTVDIDEVPTKTTFKSYSITEGIGSLQEMT